MSRLLPLLEQTLRAHHLESARLLVGVSGGADSVALLHGLVELGPVLRLNLHVLHLNHQLRGHAADADARWVAELCQSLSVPHTIGTADVKRIAADSGRGIEETARDERYRFFEESARQQRAGFVAVAHTADDQAETILHHVLRGTGLAGLCGMPRSREIGPGVRLLRPLLGIRRVDLLAYLHKLGQSFREDESNADEAFTRNRLRRQLLPQLEQEYNPQLVEALCRLGQQAAETQGALTACAAQLLERVLEKATPRECSLKWQPLAGRPRHLIREVLCQLWRQQGWPRQKMSFEHWDRLAEIALAGGAGDFPEGFHARRCGSRLEIAARSASA